MDEVSSETCFVFVKKYLKNIKKINFKSTVWFTKAISYFNFRDLTKLDYAEYS